MKKILLTEFRKRCLEFVDIMAATREPVVITRNDKPVAKLAPTNRPAQGFFGCLAGTIEIVGDIESSVQPAEDWKALR
jgi:antitoxin (DNA-binding transcriptional repressor) of toxin-antitoxin stability system